jgi:predicted SAM-dependent methyltransferase
MNLLKRLLPEFVRFKLRTFEKAIKYSFRKIIIQFPIFFNRPMKVIVGAALTYQRGWYSTNQQWLDISNPNDWNKVFKRKQLITNILAEHVFEHLSLKDLKIAINLIHSHMKKGGILRIAVPDGYNSNLTYLKNVGINGIGPDASDHKQLFNYDTLHSILKNAGFRPSLVEGFNKKGRLNLKKWEASEGYVRRSRKNNKIICSYTDENTSLIVDAIKL